MFDYRRVHAKTMCGPADIKRHIEIKVLRKKWEIQSPRFHHVTWLALENPQTVSWGFPSWKIADKICIFQQTMFQSQSDPPVLQESVATTCGSQSDVGGWWPPFKVVWGKDQSICATFLLESKNDQHCCWV